MNYIIYISTAVKLMDDYELTNILTVSRENNTRKNLTGMLLYGEGTFIQVLEGEHDELESTYEIIESDPRHKNLIRILSGEIEERNFPDWSMAFRSVNSAILSEFEGYVNPSNKEFLDTDSDSSALSVLKTFAHTNRLA